LPFSDDEEDFPMKVREIMTSDVATAQPDSTLEEVASMMKAEDTGAIPVLDDDQLIGIITDRDIVVRCIAEGKDATETNVEDILSEDLATIEPDADVEEAARLMSQRQIRRLPVVEDGVLVGVVSLGDIAVKEVDEEPASEALEGVSRGVKQEGGRGRQAGGQRAGKFGKKASLAEQEEVEEELSEYSAEDEREDERSEGRRGREMRLASAQNGQSRSGRATSNLRGRASSGVPEGRTRFVASEEQPTKGTQSTRGGRRQAAGISNRNPARENARQKKVVSARREAKASGRRRAS
jgi:CBS domain-containing protein